MNLPRLIASAERGEGRLRAAIPENWMQGRTAYGGLSAALAFEAARSAAPDLPPLRSATIDFVGPLAGTVEASVEILRSGKLALWAEARVRSEAGLGLRATFLFMRDIASSVDFNEGGAPPAPSPEEAQEAMRKGPANFFTSNFDYRHALPVSERRTPDFLRWIRLSEREGLDPVTELLCVADALPPAAMPLYETPGPVSSLTWMVNLLTPRPATRDGWWLVRATSDYARFGCSSQVMRIWDADGAPVTSGMQSVALFA